MFRKFNIIDDEKKIDARFLIESLEYTPQQVADLLRQKSSKLAGKYFRVAIVDRATIRDEYSKVLEDILKEL